MKRKNVSIGATAGSVFVFKGVCRAVLINCPNKAEKDTLNKKDNHIS